jgi:hypothetical protein
VARRAIVPILTAWGFFDGHWLYDARLVSPKRSGTGAGLLELALWLHGERVTVYVADSSADVPRQAALPDESGWGLQLVAALTEAWGTDNFHGGKRVWARLPA